MWGLAVFGHGLQLGLPHRSQSTGFQPLRLQPPTSPAPQPPELGWAPLCPCSLSSSGAVPPRCFACFAHIYLAVVRPGSSLLVFVFLVGIQIYLFKYFLREETLCSILFLFYFILCPLISTFSCPSLPNPGPHHSTLWFSKFACCRYFV